MIGRYRRYRRAKQAEQNLIDTALKIDAYAGSVESTSASKGLHGDKWVIHTDLISELHKHVWELEASRK